MRVSVLPRSQRRSHGLSVGTALVIAVATSAATIALATGSSGAKPAAARATLIDITGEEIGEAVFTPRHNGELRARVTVAIDPAVTGNLGAFHGFHIHANNDDDTADGNLDDGCIPSAATDPATWFTQVDGHWDSGGHSHGTHTGDLPSLHRQSDGEAVLEFVVDTFTALELPGKGLVVHFQADDFGKHPGIGTSDTTGNAGFRYACGKIIATGNDKSRE